MAIGSRSNNLYFNENFDLKKINNIVLKKKKYEQVDRYTNCVNMCNR